MRFIDEITPHQREILTRVPTEWCDERFAFGMIAWLSDVTTGAVMRMLSAFEHFGVVERREDALSPSHWQIRRVVYCWIKE